ncbi:MULTISPECIES: ABC transporter permease [unclassified Chelatococcus]|uniref:ABC transporter permease n=1 Tax=unclassified Chelatococcus TaxID=2638111 RepID=UPI001BCCE78A|nr:MULTISPECIES: ABC transporter permease [unclassified Chelatococcus]CAH1656961.1 dipeptide ABC transporter membrane subunit DppB [Hyphomicrobiales bacterium]MBS7742378.1 ABC transporter permease [Chelatococcus sp. HY11]MBX3542504.1 ABC transporter permease [Chelatococcus sp.]MCO5075279.1 ABC transporter permease [Chelatococcus sp.]CAH1695938.1 dipeptide ABC transporter membrane subunit DppB [Hyphomicrobiales bacterium]
MRLITFLVQRMMQLVPLLFMVTFLIFSMMQLLPGDPTFAMLGEQAGPQERAALRAKLGLDQPLPVQYMRWVANTASGDLGTSLRTREPVNEMLMTRIPVTLQLTVMAILLSVIIGVPAGILAALRRNSWIDLVVSFLSMGGVAMPFFWMGMLLIGFFTLRLGWLPPSGYVSPTTDLWLNLKLMLMPTITIGTTMAALVMRQTRTAMLQVLGEDFIRTARAKGAGEPRVIGLHALRNALIPVVTVIGLQTGALVSGAVVTETIFSLPGLGRMLVEGIFERDIAPVQAAILIIVVGVLLVNLLTDLAYVVLDRRIKL